MPVLITLPAVGLLGRLKRWQLSRSRFFCLLATAALTLLICCRFCCVPWSLTGDQSGGTATAAAACTATIFRLMRANGWPGDHKVSYLMRLSREADQLAATADCVTPSSSSSSMGGRQHRQQQQLRGCFVEKLQPAVRNRSAEHLATVAGQLEQAGIEYYLDMGTALGAYRHMAIIPYDEDLDVRINAEQKAAARRVLLRLRYQWPQLLFQDTEWQNQHWKVHFRDTMDPVLKRHVALDVFFYHANHSSQRLHISEPPFSFPLGDIFPLRRRPFHGAWYPTPNSIGAMISGYFPNTGLADCVYYVHDLPFINQCAEPVVPCDQLRHRYSFAETLQLPAGGQVQFLVEPESGRVSQVAFIAGANRV